MDGYQVERHDMTLLGFDHDREIQLRHSYFRFGIELLKWSIKVLNLKKTLPITEPESTALPKFTYVPKVSDYL